MRIWFRLLVIVGMVTIVLVIGAMGGFDSHDPSNFQTPQGQAQATDSGYPQYEHADEVSQFYNEGFTIGYSEQQRTALWVSFRLSSVKSGHLPPRPRFERDPRSSAGVAYRDFGGSGYDRGHMAPNYSMAKLYGIKAQQQSFLMTNIVPQRARLNQLLWQRFEEVEIDQMAQRWRELWVTTGPVFTADNKTLRGGVSVPNMFYRIWLDETESGQLRTLAFLVPQTVRGDEPLTDFVSSVDHIEDLTGLDFYPQLSAAAQASIEAAPADAKAWIKAWEFDEIACLPARYAKDWQGRDGIRLRFDRCQ